MNQLNGHKEFAQVVADNYSQMEEQLQDAATKNHHLAVENGVLLAEVNMLREALQKSERETRRLQAVSSTFGGQARALQSVFTSIVELAIKNGYEAADAPEAPQKAVQEPYVEPPQSSGYDAGNAADALRVDWATAQSGLKS